MGRIVEKLKYTEVKVLREELRNKNMGICPICQEALSPEEAALDHCHKTGHIRNTIHKDCNILLGKIENYIGRYGKRLRDPVILDTALTNIVSYIIEDYRINPYHPTHKTPEDKELRQHRSRLRKAKKPETKEKYKKLIKEHQERANR